MMAKTKELFLQTGCLLLALGVGALACVLFFVLLPVRLLEAWGNAAQNLRYPHRGMYAEMARRMKEKADDEN